MQSAEIALRSDKVMRKPLPDPRYQVNAIYIGDGLAVADRVLFVHEPENADTDPKAYTWGELYERADGCAYGEASLVAKDEARYQLCEVIQDLTSHNPEDDDCTEETIDNYLRKYGEVKFDERGNIVDDTEFVAAITKAMQKAQTSVADEYRPTCFVEKMSIPSSVEYFTACRFAEGLGNDAHWRGIRTWVCDAPLPNSDNYNMVYDKAPKYRGVLNGFRPAFKLNDDSVKNAERCLKKGSLVIVGTLYMADEPVKIPDDDYKTLTTYEEDAALELREPLDDAQYQVKAIYIGDGLAVADRVLLQCDSIQQIREGLDVDGDAQSYDKVLEETTVTLSELATLLTRKLNDNRCKERYMQSRADVGYAPDEYDVGYLYGVHDALLEIMLTYGIAPADEKMRWRCGEGKAPVCVCRLAAPLFRTSRN